MAGACDMVGVGRVGGWRGARGVRTGSLDLIGVSVRGVPRKETTDSGGGATTLTTPVALVPLEAISSNEVIDFFTLFTFFSIARGMNLLYFIFINQPYPITNFNYSANN